MNRSKQAVMPAYTDGCFALYDIVDEKEGDQERVIRERPGYDEIWYRELAVYDRTRITFEQADMEISMKVCIPKWDGISSSCVCIIDDVQYKVYNKANVVSRQGYPETELTLIRPSMDYEVI